MTQKVSATIPGTIEQVINVITSQNFAQHNTEQVGGRFVSQDVTDDKNAGFSVTTKRILPTTFIPDVAKKIIGNEMSLSQTENWKAPSNDTREADVEIDVEGLPIKVTGTEKLTQSTLDQVTFEFEGSLNASIPIVGKKIAAIAEPKFTQVLQLQAQAIADWIANHPETAG